MAGIVVGVDSSPHARRALEWALEEAELRHVPLTVVRVVAPVPNNVYATYPENRGCTPEELAAVDRDVDELVQKVAADRGRKPAVPVHPRARVGDAAPELVHAAQDATMLVVGSHGAGGLRRALLGSVSDAVVRHARCPVVVIPARFAESTHARH